MDSYDFECIFCDHEFDRDFDVRCHLENSHGWDDLQEQVNQQFSPNRGKISCGYCNEVFVDSFNDYLHHVLSMCPSSSTNLLYLDRQMALTNMMENMMEQACQRAVRNPTGILRAAVDWRVVKIRDVDIAAISDISKQVILVEVAVPWDMNIPCVHRQKMSALSNKAEGLIKEGVDCRFYSVEVGARGIVAKSLRNFLCDIGVPHEAIAEIELQAENSAIQESKKLLRTVTWDCSPQEILLHKLNSVNRQ